MRFFKLKTAVHPVFVKKSPNANIAVWLSALLSFKKVLNNVQDASFFFGSCSTSQPIFAPLTLKCKEVKKCIQKLLLHHLFACLRRVLEIAK